MLRALAHRRALLDAHRAMDQALLSAALTWSDEYLDRTGAALVHALVAGVRLGVTPPRLRAANDFVGTVTLFKNSMTNQLLNIKI